MYAGVCVWMRTHIHSLRRGYSECEPKGRDGMLGEYEESRWTKTQDKYIRICVRSTQVYINAERRDEILD